MANQFHSLADSVTAGEKKLAAYPVSRVAASPIDEGQMKLSTAPPSDTALGNSRSRNGSDSLSNAGELQKLSLIKISEPKRPY